LYWFNLTSCLFRNSFDYCRYIIYKHKLEVKCCVQIVGNTLIVAWIYYYIGMWTHNNIFFMKNNDRLRNVFPRFPCFICGVFSHYPLDKFNYIYYLIWLKTCFFNSFPLQPFLKITRIIYIYKYMYHANGSFNVTTILLHQYT